MSVSLTSRRESNLSSKPKRDRRGSLFGSLTAVTEHTAVQELDSRILSLTLSLSDETHNKSAVHNNLANALVQKGDLHAAVQQYKLAIELDEDDAAAIMNLGVAYKFMDRLDDAVECFRRSLALRPDNESEHYNLANTLMKLWDGEHASSPSPSSSEQQDSSQQHQQRRYVYIDSAIEHYTSCLSLSPSHSNAHMNLGTAYKALGLLSLAVTHMEASIKYGNPAIAFNAHYNLANAMAERCGHGTGTGGGGETTTTTTTDSARKAPDPHILPDDPAYRAVLLEAAKHYKLALSLESDNVDALANYGVVLSRLEMHEESLEVYEELLDIASGDYALHFNCGNSKAGMGDFKGAVEQYKWAIELHGGMHLPSMYNMGTALMEMKNYAEAILVFEALLEEDEEEDPITYYNLGIMYHLTKDFDAAIEALQACLTLDPSNVLANVSLGNQLDDRGEHHSAVEAYRQALVHEPTNVDAMRYLAYTLADLDGVQEACSLLEKVLELSPDSSDEVQDYLNQCRAKLDNTRELQGAIDEAKEQVDEEPTVARRGNLAMVLREAQRFDDAIEQLEECLKLQAGHPQITKMLEEVRAEQAAMAETVELGEEAVVVSTGRFGMFAGKKKGRALSLSKGGSGTAAGSSPGKKQGSKGARTDSLVGVEEDEETAKAAAKASSPKQKIAKNKVGVSG